MIIDSFVCLVGHFQRLGRHPNVILGKVPKPCGVDRMLESQFFVGLGFEGSDVIDGEHPAGGFYDLPMGS